MADGLGEHEVTLRDGTRALVRPIRPTDTSALQAGLRQLSPHSRHMRFHTPIDHLSSEQLAYLTQIDYRNHMAWVAVNRDEPDQPGMGVARYVRLGDEPTVAEAAVTVIDRYQGRGLATVLLRRLAMSAADNGITTLRNYVLAENTAMLDLFDTLGAQRVEEAGGVYRIDIPVPGRDDRPTTTARRILREVATGVVPPLRGLFPPDRRGDSGGD